MGLLLLTRGTLVRCDLRGTHGRLMAGYQEAAVLGPWRLTGSAGDDVFALVATVQAVHPVWAGISPLDLRLTMPGEGGSEWRWPVERVGVEVGHELALVLVGLPRMGAGV